MINVGIRGSSRGSSTDARGQFAISRLAPGTYSLIISFVGLERQEITVQLTPYLPFAVR